MGKSLSREDLLDDIVCVALNLGVDVEDVTYRMYATHGLFSEKTVYAKFKGLGGWSEIIKLASERLEQEINETTSEDFPESELAEPIRACEIKFDTSSSPALEQLEFSFNLEEAMSTGFSANTSLDVPKIHEIGIGKSDILVAVPDIHSPFFHRGWMVWVVRNILALAESGMYENVHVIQMGDAYDLYSLGKHDKHRYVDPADEIKAGTGPLIQFWKILDKPKIKRYQLIGNHDTRSEKFCTKNASSLRGFVPTAKSMLTFENVFTVDNERDGILFTVDGDTDKVLFMHGYLSDSLAHVRKHGVSVVHAHSHRGSLNFFTGKFALDCGFGGDPNSWAFAYTTSAMKKEWNWAMGKIEITKGGKLQPSIVKYHEGE